jgi:hypothetical protein
MEFPTMYNAPNLPKDTVSPIVILNAVDKYLTQYENMQLLMIGGSIVALMILVFPRLKYGISSMVISSLVTYMNEMEKIRKDAVSLNDRSPSELAVVAIVAIGLLLLYMWLVLKFIGFY